GLRLEPTAWGRRFVLRAWLAGFPWKQNYSVQEDPGIEPWARLPPARRAKLPPSAERSPTARATLVERHRPMTIQPALAAETAARRPVWPGEHPGRMAWAD